MPQKRFELTINEEAIVGMFEDKLQKKGVRIYRKTTRGLFEKARQELIDRARERDEWNSINKLYNPKPNTKTANLLLLQMEFLYEEEFSEAGD